MSNISQKTTSKIRIISFISVGLIIFVLLWKLLLPEWNYPVLNANISLANSEAKRVKEPQVVFLGASHMQYSISPMQIYRDYNVITYNMARCDQPVVGSYYYVTKMFDDVSPKLIVFDVGGLFNESKYDVAYRYILDDFSYSEVKKNVVDQYIIDQKNIYKYGEKKLKKLELGAWFPFYNYHDRWYQLVSSDFRLSSDGYFLQGQNIDPWIKKALYPEEDIDVYSALIEENAPKYYERTIDGVYRKETEEKNTSSSAEISDSNLEYLRKIQECCRRNNCELLLVKIPTGAAPTEYSSAWTKARHEKMKEVAEALDIDFVDLQYDVDLKIDWNKETSDEGMHLNLLGAEKATDWLGSYIVNNYELNRQTNSDYERKLEKYEKYIEVAHLELEEDFCDYVSRIIEESSKSKLTIVMSAKDDMIGNLSDSDIDALHSMGLRSHFENMNYADSFIAVIDEGNVAYECISNRKQTYSGKFDSNSINAVSGGYLDGNVSSMKINNIDYSTNKRGINIVVFDKESGLVLDSVCFDTWSLEHKAYHVVGNKLFAYQNYLIYE